MSLSHDSLDCTGTWGVRTIGGGSYWKCDACGEIAYPSAANHEAAIRENAAGNTLDRLTKEGRKMLDTDGTVP